MPAVQGALWGEGSPVQPRSAGLRGPRNKPQPLDDLTPGSKNPQLPMFMSPREIQKNYQGTDGDRGFKNDDGTMDFGLDYHTRDALTEAGLGRRETVAEMAVRKLSESHASGVDASVAKHGVQDPIQLQNSAKDWQPGSQGKFQIMDGNHRLASAADQAPDKLLPVEHHDYADEARYTAVQRVAKRQARAQARRKQQQASGQQAGYANLLAALRGP